MSGIRRLRALAVAASLQPATSLGDAVRKLEFVQYDPIRRPARAQDLILHQRVVGYRAGDLDRQYRRLGLEEDRFYVYGAMTRDLNRLLHPRPDRAQPRRAYRPRGLAARVLAFVERNGPTRPNDVKPSLGTRRTVNAWGGFSSATTEALEELQYYGLVRVAWRENGIKIYEACSPRSDSSSPERRLRQLTLRIVEILAPISEASLRRTLLQLNQHSGGLEVRASVAGDLLGSGAVESCVVGGVRYLAPAGALSRSPEETPQRVRLLAPFDPVVWDRARFEHLWGWAYRFEAYTPKPNRRFGYYAMPMLWGDRAIGWVNCEVGTNGALDVRAEYAVRPPRSRQFTRSFDREIAGLEAMLAGHGDGA